MKRLVAMINSECPIRIYTEESLYIRRTVKTPIHSVFHKNTGCPRVLCTVLRGRAPALSAMYSGTGGRNTHVPAGAHGSIINNNLQQT